MAMRIQTGEEPIPGYKLLERIGGGGFGEVWKAEAPGGLPKAIKFVHGDLRSGADDDLRRAEQELKALKRVQAVRHPYLLSLERYDIIDGRLMIVMELADCNLWDRFRECRAQGLPGIPRDSLLRYLAESAEVLDLMNAQHQLQHLDIKPQNLFLIHDHIKVADFGLVKDLEGVRASVTGGVTPVYAAPETFDGIITRYCDQYSLAIVYQELLTGVRPFAGGSVQQLIMQHIQTPPNVSPLPGSDRGVLLKALAKRPEDRYPSCMAMVKALYEAGLAERSATVVDAEPAQRPPAPPPDTPATIIRMRREDADGPAPVPPSRVAPPEQTGPGCLLPALVVGLGGHGLEVLRRFKRHLAERFGAADRLPQVRFVGIDTDPETVQAAVEEAPGGLTLDEVFLARLNRPSHYLKPRRHGSSLLEGWFDPQMLYRIPRNLLTTGLRMVGRLAFCDHYRPLAHKLRAELEVCTHPDALAQAEAHTKLGLRTNRPRVYIACGLGGGTGAGMFLDVAYTLRRWLRYLGYLQSEVVGLFLLPAVERSPNRLAGVANAYAALTELHHYSLPETVFAARHDDKDADFHEVEPPFTRFALLPLPTADAASDPHGLAAEFLGRDLASPLGRIADLRRSVAVAPPGEGPGLPVCGQSFGFARFAWPRLALLDWAACRLCVRVLARWTAEDAASVRVAVQARVTEQWARQRLGPESLIEQLQAAGERALGQPPEAAFRALAEPFAPRGRWRQGVVDLDRLWQALEDLSELIGPPSGSQVDGQPGRLALALEEAAAELAGDWGEKVAQLAVGLIEQPDFRLAGAEEAIRQLDRALEQALEHYTPLAVELTDQADRAYAQLQLALVPNRRRATPAEVTEALQVYPKWRFEALVLRHVCTLCSDLRAKLSDQLREVDFYRQRLGDLRRTFQATVPPDAAEEHLLPPGCATLEQAAERMLAAVTPEDVRALDRRLQSLVEKQFVALVHVCMNASGLMGNLEPVMLQQARDFLSGRLAATNVVELFLARYPAPARATAALAEAFEAARPALAPVAAVRLPEVCVVALPPGEALQPVLKQALGDRDLSLAASQDDITVYREVARLPLDLLPNLGPTAQQVYQQLSSQPNSFPHTRIDVPTWHGADVK